MRSRTTQRRFARMGWILAALRLLVFAIAMQTGGMIRDAADVVTALVTDAPDDDDDCPQDSGPCHCPPGCPNCHCAHGVGSLPVVAAASLLLGESRSAAVVGVPYDAARPPLPDLRSVYRPPRSPSSRS